MGQPRDEPDLRPISFFVNNHFEFFEMEPTLPPEDDSLRRTNFVSRPRSGTGARVPRRFLAPAVSAAASMGGI